MSGSPYVGFTDGASRSTRNLSSAAWVIYDPHGELVAIQGVCLGCMTNNVAEYSAVIELLAEAINLGPNHHARRAAVHDLSQPRRDPGSLPTRRGEYLLTEIEDPSMRI